MPWSWGRKEDHDDAGAGAGGDDHGPWTHCEGHSDADQLCLISRLLDSGPCLPSIPPTAAVS